MCSILELSGQADSLVVDTISITGDLITGCSDFGKLHISEQTQNIHNLQGNWFLKSNGPGGVATISIRGGSSSQNNIFWNNIPLNNPMLGLNDLSLLPLGIIESVKVTKGGNSGSRGQGSLSGSIDIDTDEFFFKKNELNLNFGSFGQKMGTLITHIGKKKITLQSKYFYQNADNNFNYTLKGTQAERENSNAEFTSTGTIQSLKFRPHRYHHLDLNYWGQTTERQIPPLTTQNESLAHQEDNQHRLNFNWSFDNLAWSVTNNFAYINEHNNYFDPLILLEARNQFKRLYHHFELRKRIDKTRIIFQNQINFSKGISDNYSDQNTLNSISPMFSLFHNFGLIETEILLRREWSNLSDGPLSPTLLFTWFSKKGIETELKLSREYRLPTLNELFWRPGGNPNIQPESGWNQELSVRYDFKYFQTEFGLYHRLINDWILWSPDENSFFFSVDNISRVRSYGADITILYYEYFGDLVINGSFNYAYTKSISEVSIPSTSVQEGEQLIYIPEHTADAAAEVKYKNSTFSARVIYTINFKGINENIDQSIVSNLHLSHKLITKKFNIELGLGINNLTNEDYRIVERRPMPGRHFNLFLKTSIN